MSQPISAAPQPTVVDQPKGHPVAFWFFFWGEFAERCSYYGMRAILVLYMINVLGIEKSNATMFNYLFLSACYFLPLLGGWIADNFLGKYWTIVGFSVPYVLGQILVGQENPIIFAFSLALLAMGSGVIKPNISTLMGLTYDQQRPGQDKLRSDAFSLFYMAINVGAFCSQLAMPILRQKYGYKVAFLFPAGLMAVALTVFALGKQFYAKETVVRKKVSTPEETALRWVTLKSIGSLFGLVIFFWAIFDQSSGTWITFAGDYMNCFLFGEYVPPDGMQWVNALGIIVGLPISMVLWRVLAAKGYKIRATDKMTVGFLLTGVTMAMMGIAAYSNTYIVGTELSVEKGTFTYTENAGGDEGVNEKTGQGFFKNGTVVTPHGTITIPDGEFGGKIGPKLTDEEKEARKNDPPIKTDKGQTFEFHSGKFSFKEATFKNIKGEETPLTGDFKADGKLLVEVTEEEKKMTVIGGKDKLSKIDKYVPLDERVSILWIVLATIVITVAEILISVTGLELAFVAAPQSMKSFVTACWLVTVGLANLALNIPLSKFLYPVIHPGLYFIILTVVLFVVMAAFIQVGKGFNKAIAKKDADEAARKANQGNPA